MSGNDRSAKSAKVRSSLRGSGRVRWDEGQWCGQVLERSSVDEVRWDEVWSVMKGRSVLYWQVDQLRTAYIRLGQVRWGQVWWRQIWSGHVSCAQVRLTKVNEVMSRTVMRLRPMYVCTLILYLTTACRQWRRSYPFLWTGMWQSCFQLKSIPQRWTEQIYFYIFKEVNLVK